MGCDGYIRIGHHPVFRCYACGKIVTDSNHSDHQKCARDRGATLVEWAIPVDIENFEER